jgi:metal-dependent amidase/aminoacylase/carboxypeptidase family protein
VLLFQPAEENAAGAAAVAADARFAERDFDRVFALHNHPGYPEGAVLIRPGTFYCASRGMAVRLVGATSHASEPERGNNPARAMAEILRDLDALATDALRGRAFAMITPVHARLGDPGFGVSPGEAEIMATLRTETDEAMEALCRGAEQRVRRRAARSGLACTVDWEDVFPATVNDPAACAVVRKAAAAARLERVELEGPFRCSEDFGVFTARHRGAAFGLGSGEAQPALHRSDYDFPDGLIAPGLRLAWELLKAAMAA